MSEKKHKLELSDTEFMFMFTAIPVLMEQLFKSYGTATDYKGIIEISELALKMEPTFDIISKEANVREAKRQQFELESLLGGIPVGGGQKAN